MLVFPKVRLSDIILKDKTILTNREFSFYTRSHCDFVVTNEDLTPAFIVEYDGPLHALTRQIENDNIKNELCKKAGIGLIRINERHISKSYRGMSVLRWIIEVSELERGFYEAQASGQIPYDEPFNPALVFYNKTDRKFPYWLSASSVSEINKFLDGFPSKTTHGWASLVGYDKQNVSYRLSCIYFESDVLWAKTAVRSQNFDFPRFELHEEIDSCELGLCLKKFQERKLNPIGSAQFQEILDNFTSEYSGRLNHSRGSFPFQAKWPF